MTKSPEAKLQEAIVVNFNHNYPKYRGRLIAINNNSQNAIQGAQNTSKGIKKGVADMCFLCEGGRVIWIELKAGYGSQSPAQERWQSKVQLIGHTYCIVRSEQEFYHVIGGQLND